MFSDEKINLKCYGFLTFILICCDQLSKYWIKMHFDFTTVKKILPFLNLILSHNSGAAFGSLNHAGGWQRWFFIAIAAGISIIIIYILSQTKKSEAFTAWGLSFILAGAIGNLIDRIYLSYVIDFIDFHINTWHFATFNLADSFINVGIALWLIGVIIKSKTKGY